MTTKQSPTVKEDGLLYDSELPGLLAIPHERAKVQSSGWHDWLLHHNKFRFESAAGSFTAFKSSKGYWTAQRRVDRNLRHQYLGESHTLTYEALEETAKILAAGDYWHKHVSNKGRPREVDKELLRNQKSHTLYETEQTGLEAKVRELEEEVRRLGAELNLTRQMRDTVQGKHDKVVEDNGQLIRLVRETQEQVRQCENKLSILSEIHRESDLRCQELESLVEDYQSRKYEAEESDRIQRTRTIGIDLEEFYDAVILSHPPRERKVIGKPMTRFKALIKEALTRRGMPVR
jgi:hypothetical protein